MFDVDDMNYTVYTLLSKLFLQYREPLGAAGGLACTSLLLLPLTLGKHILAQCLSVPNLCIIVHYTTNPDVSCPLSVKSR